MIAIEVWLLLIFIYFKTQTHIDEEKIHSPKQELIFNCQGQQNLCQIAGFG